MWVVQSGDIEERVEVTRLLAKMFSERNSALASQNAPLWLCFVGRYKILCQMYDVMCGTSQKNPHSALRIYIHL